MDGWGGMEGHEETRDEKKLELEHGWRIRCGVYVYVSLYRIGIGIGISAFNIRHSTFDIGGELVFLCS